MPAHLISDWYKPRQSIRIQYAIEADDKERIEKDLKEDATLPWNCKMEITKQYYIIWDSNDKLVDCGKFITKAKEVTSYPETYKLLPPDKDVPIRMQGETCLESVMKTDDSKSYDIFIGQANYEQGTYALFFFYQDRSAYYKSKYPEAGVKTVVVQQAIALTPYVFF